MTIFHVSVSPTPAWKFRRGDPVAHGVETCTWTNKPSVFCCSTKSRTLRWTPSISMFDETIPWTNWIAELLSLSMTIGTISPSCCHPKPDTTLWMSLDSATLSWLTNCNAYNSDSQLLRAVLCCCLAKVRTTPFWNVTTPPVTPRLELNLQGPCDASLKLCTIKLLGE